MGLTLDGGIASDARELIVTGSVPDSIVPGYRFRLDDEMLRLRNFGETRSGNADRPDRNRWRVARGIEGSTATSHDPGADVLGVVDAWVAGDDEDAPSPFDGGPGGASTAADVTYDNATSELAATDVQGAIDEVVAAGGGDISSPLDISGCVLLLDARDLDLTDGDPVETWADASESGFDAGTAPTVQTIDITGASSGAFKVLDLVTNDPSASLAWNISALALQTALEALPSIGAGNVSVTLDTQVYTITLPSLAWDAIGVGTFGVDQDTLDVLPTVTVIRPGSGPGKPTYVTMPDGLPAVEFDSAADPAQALGWSGAALGLFNGTSGMTIALVVDGGVAVNANAFFASLGNDATTARVGIDHGGLTIQRTDDDGQPKLLDALGSPWTDAAGFIAVIGGADWGVGEICTAFVRNAMGFGELGPIDLGETDPFIPTTDSLVMRLGGTATDPFGGHVRMLAVYDRLLSAKELRQLAEYLATTWNAL